MRTESSYGAALITKERQLAIKPTRSLGKARFISVAETQQITHSDFATEPLGENESIQGASRQNPGAAGLSTEEKDLIALLGKKKDFQRFWDFLSFLISFLFFSFLPNKTLTFSFF